MKWLRRFQWRFDHVDWVLLFRLDEGRCRVFTVRLLLLLLCMNAPAQEFTITLLGTGSPQPRIDRFGPATLIQAGGQNLLIDCGRGAAQRIWQLGMPLSKITAVFLTHLHSDHIVGIPDLWLTGWLPAVFGQRTHPFRIWGPAGTKAMMGKLTEAFQADIQFRLHDEKDPPEGIAVIAEDIAQGVVYEKDGLKVTVFDVDHRPISPAFGYRIDYAGYSVVLSGDTRVSENLIRFAKGTDVLIHEVAMARQEALDESAPLRAVIAHHTSPEEAGTVFSRVKPRLAIFNHIVFVTANPKISEPTVADVVAAARKTWDGPMEVGEDLMRVEIGKTIAVHRP
jgi:ribonuclease Z